MLLLFPMGKNENTFGEKVQQLRVSKRLSQVEVMHRSRRGGRQGISDGYVSQIETGLILPDNLTIERIKALASGNGVHPIKICAWALDLPEIEATKIELISLIESLPDSRKQDLLNMAILFYKELKEVLLEPGIEDKEFDPEGIAKDRFEFESSKGGKKTKKTA